MFHFEMQSTRRIAFFTTGISPAEWEGFTLDFYLHFSWLFVLVAVLDRVNWCRKGQAYRVR